MHPLQIEVETLAHAEALSEGFAGAWPTLLIVVIAVVGYFVQLRLRSVMSRYSEVAMPNGMTGAEMALKMLHDHGIYNVQVTRVRGHLTDHFNPTTMTINLSDTVYSSRSIAAAAVACHESGHAVQYVTGYSPLSLRSQLVSVVNFSSRIATWVIMLGIVLMAVTNNALLCWVGIALVALSALFALVTLPVEYNASERALSWLQGSGILSEEEMRGARTALRWAARTYLVAAVGAVATIIYYVMLINSRRR